MSFFSSILVSHYDELMQNGPNDNCRKILVPLCGKSLDLKWLWEKDQRNHVFGIEGVRKAIVDFFHESGILYKTKPGLTPDVIEYQSLDGRLTILETNFFNLPKSYGPFDVAYDRASLVAVDPGDRNTYVDTIKRMLSGVKNFKYLLVTVEYDKTKVVGPPHSLSSGDVNDLFGDFCSIQQTSSKRLDFDTNEYIKSKFVDAKVDCTHHVYLLQNK